VSADVAVLGAAGLLGRHLVAALGARARPLTRAQADVTDPAALARALSGARVVVSCAAWTDVDANERDPERARRVNGEGAGHAAAAARAAGARFVQVSTDFVFDGARAEPYRPGDAPAPLSVYGRAKRLGEELALAAGGEVVRVQGLYGEGGTSFSSRLPELLASGRPLRLDDERRVQPTWARTAAAAIARLALAPARAPIVHVAARGETTWAGFAARLAEHLGLAATFTRVASRELGLVAARPRNCLFAPEGDLPSWQDDLAAYTRALRGGP